MMLTGIRHEHIDGTFEGRNVDIDRYDVEMKRPISTHEFSVYVSHHNKKISGDVIRYGSWDDLDETEVLTILKLIEEQGKLVRPYNGYVFEVS